MKFGDVLNKYIKLIGCSAKELADSTGLSSSLISRYRNGDRVPKCDSEQIDLIIKGFVCVSANHNVKIDIKQLEDEISESLKNTGVDFETFRVNFNILIRKLKINAADISRYIGYDSSFISKMKNGLRKPSDMDGFVNSVCKYVVNNVDNINKSEIVELIGVDTTNSTDLFDKLYKWITTSNGVKKEYGVNSFLEKLDDFDLNDYIKSIKFDKIKVPTVPIQISKSKTYYGLDGFKEAQIDVLKSIVLSRSMSDVFFYSNMPMIETSKDLEFSKKFMMGIAFMLKKGLKLNMVHNLDRPFDELMLGLEGWIPLYMTGQIRPYYFKNNSANLFSQIFCISESAVLSGECIGQNINSATMFVTTKSSDIEHYSNSVRLLLNKADRLMDIYNNDSKELYFDVLDKNSHIEGDRKNILTSLPLYVLSDKLIIDILDKNDISDNDKNYILDGISKIKYNIKKTLENNTIRDEIYVMSKKEFSESIRLLDLSQIFYDKKVAYSYDEYLKHIDDLKRFSKNNNNYEFSISKNNIFKNINISIIHGKVVIISKTNYPTIHFVIHYPKLVNAIEQFKVPISKNK